MSIARYTDVELEELEFSIQEEIEFLTTVTNNEIECISIENLESILTKFLKRTINLSIE